MSAQLDLREVDVARVNERGIQTTAGEWLNFSRFASASDVTLPSIGDRVLLHLDRQGFIRKIETVSVARTVGEREDDMTGEAASEAPKLPPSRDMVVTRLACLNTATAILSSGARVADPSDVVKLAEQLEAWANR